MEIKISLSMNYSCVEIDGDFIELKDSIFHESEESLVREYAQIMYNKINPLVVTNAFFSVRVGAQLAEIWENGDEKFIFTVYNDDRVEILGAYDCVLNDYPNYYLFHFNGENSIRITPVDKIAALGIIHLLDD